MKKILIDECHLILLDIARCIDKICTKHNIPYYMLGGTMLGAIRHGGFIPWDDDFDIGIEREYYDEFLRIAELELPSHIKVTTHRNSKGIFFGFAKIQDVRTMVEEPTYLVENKDRNGINIDIFPLDSCDEQIKGYNVIRGLFRLQRLLFVNSTHPTLFNTIIRKTLRFLIPLDKNYLIEKVNKYIKRYEDRRGEYLVSYWSIYGKKTMCSKQIWGNPTRYNFEDEQFLGASNADAYLKNLFGDYMQLPPEEKRRVHCENLYWK